MEPTNLFYYGSILFGLIVLTVWGRWFYRQTNKEKNWKMFIWVGAIAVVVGALIIYTTFYL